MINPMIVVMVMMMMMMMMVMMIKNADSADNNDVVNDEIPIVTKVIMRSQKEEPQWNSTSFFYMKFQHKT